MASQYNHHIVILEARSHLNNVSGFWEPAQSIQERGRFIAYPLTNAYVIGYRFVNSVLFRTEPVLINHQPKTMLMMINETIANNTIPTTK
jgi:hypothetical protein